MLRERIIVMAAVKKVAVFLICLALLGGIVYFLVQKGTVSDLQNTIKKNPTSAPQVVDPNKEPLSGKTETGHLQHTGTSQDK